MNRTSFSLPPLMLRGLSLWIVALGCLGGAACFRGYDPTKIKCVNSSSCPSGSSCIMDNDKYGHCQPGAAPTDGRTADLSSGASGGAGGTTATDGPRAGGSTGSSQGGRSGTLEGGAGGSGGATSQGGGAGGTAPDGPVGAGGTSNDAPNGSGGTAGTTSQPDAPIRSDAPGANGSPCKNDGECSSTHCIDDVCCATTCTGCNACTTDLTAQPNGTCAFVLSGRIAHQACTDETATKPCGNDGTCDGKGACRKVAQGKPCGEASCNTDTNSFIPVPTCDGAGACVPADQEACSPYQCSATGCNKKCSLQTDCLAGTYCDKGLGTCAPTKANGVAATDTFECRSGFVADGVCCNTACTEQCKACSLNGNKGTCTRISSGQPLHGDACAGDDSTCAGSCNGSKDTCFFPPSEQSCGTASCSTNLENLNASKCSGSGSCSRPANQNCSTNNQYCDSTTTSCAAKKSSGSCSLAIQCASNCCSGGSCASLGTNSNCGACGDACTGGKTCQGGSCACNTSAGYVTCGSSCCPSGQTCNNGICCTPSSQCGTRQCGQASNSCGGLVNCGPNGGGCPAGQTCNSSAGNCESTCQGGLSICNSCLVWNFESGTTQSWAPATSNCTVGIASGTGAGAYSLAVNANSPDGSTIEVTVPLCGNGASISIPTEGYRFNGQVKFQSNTAFGDDGQGGGSASILISGESYYYVVYSGSPISQSQGWIPLSGPISQRTAENAAHLTLRFFPNSAWSGVIYIDSITINAN